jgi:Berberine and berberine like
VEGGGAEPARPTRRTLLATGLALTATGCSPAPARPRPTGVSLADVLPAGSGTPLRLRAGGHSYGGWSADAALAGFLARARPGRELAPPPRPRRGRGPRGGLLGAGRGRLHRQGARPRAPAAVRRDVVVARTREALRQWTGTAAYVNHADAGLPDRADACWGENLPRLRRVAADVDPDGVFTAPGPVQA